MSVKIEDLTKSDLFISGYLAELQTKLEILVEGSRRKLSLELDYALDEELTKDEYKQTLYSLKHTSKIIGQELEDFEGEIEQFRRTMINMANKPSEHIDIHSLDFMQKIV